ncbi:MAG: hypothetical protein M4579_004062 [Chaenotheca gracillima]|nr:MAG: hypothetical protein M4579_004062 [Chaenotheca gracillima]
MASGVEIAGLVLGTFPLLISACEHYREGLEPLKDWYRYRLELESFLRKLDRQHVLFHLTLEELLSSIAPNLLLVDDLLEEPGGTLWQDRDLEKDLQERLRSSYATYFATVAEMNKLMKVLKRGLDLDDAGKPKSHDQGGKSNADKIRWEYQRARFSWSKKKREKTISALSECNDILASFTQRTERLAPSRRRAKLRLAIPAHQIRKHASNLHAMITQGWKCKCSAAHNANLLLEKRFEAPKDVKKRSVEDPYLRVIFSADFSSPSFGGPPWTWHETDILPIECDQLLQEALTSKPTKIPKVAFTDLNESPKLDGGGAINHASLQEIKDLCVTIFETPQLHKCLGYLLDHHKTRHVIYSSPKLQIQQEALKVVDLGTVLSQSSSQSLTWKERLHLAVTLASTLLQLHQTPWLNERWSGKDIYFLQTGTGMITSQPYVSQKFLKAPTSAAPNGQSGTSPPRSCNESVFSLGIVLLELCFNQPLEDRRLPEDLGPDGQPNAFTDLSTARRLCTEALQERGPRFGDAVRRCIFCSFEPRSTDLQDDAFREAVYNNVVIPLEEDLQYFEGVKT